MASEHGKASFLPAYAVYAGRSVVSSEFRPYFIILLKGVDFIMMIVQVDLVVVMKEDMEVGVAEEAVEIVLELWLE